ncbi:hypothetical protein Acr_00g0039490 [Actinidia rufa]|uniref:FLZ-type domain-containing protein n=1 Tax=Actinidia rufa TaxID=165716 RepID=A0A7J0DHG2_9ERIC|nr:hypothetical protein Acr_00g0039490 [Actinidia rufa]
MPRKRNRSYHKDKKMCHPISDAIPESDVLGQKHKTNSFFNVPGLFEGFIPKSSESDSVRSPTSPLDFRVFSNLTNPFIRSPKSSSHHQKSWDCNKVGLGIVDSLDNDAKFSGKILRSSNSKNILFGPQMKTKTLNFRTLIDSFDAPKSLPKDYGGFPHTHQIKPSNLQKGSSNVVFEIGETPFESTPFGKVLSCSLDSGSHLTSCLTNRSTDSSSGNFGSANGTIPVSYPLQIGNSSSRQLNSIPISMGSGHDFFGSLSASEIELSEDYTCVKTYGPNPKTTHIFGDCILECDNNNLTNLSKNEEEKIQLHPAIPAKSSEIPTLYPSSDFLRFCCSCKKKLEGEDIYMYRGEKAFCSWDCRSHEILIDEAMEDSPEPNNGEELSETGMFITT